MQSTCNQHYGHLQESEEEQAGLPAARRTSLSPSVCESVKSLYNSGAKPAVILRSVLGDPSNDSMLITIYIVYGMIRNLKHKELDGREAIEVLFRRLQDEGQHTTAKLDDDHHVKHLFFAPSH